MFNPFYIVCQSAISSELVTAGAGSMMLSTATSFSGNLYIYSIYINLPSLPFLSVLVWFHGEQAISWRSCPAGAVGGFQRKGGCLEHGKENQI